MRQATFFLMAAGLIAAAGVGLGRAADDRGDRGSCVSCTGDGCGCEPRCKATWGEATTTKPAFSMRCEYACARGRDPWHAPEPDCRCHPPCGEIYIKKRLYKQDGEETVERVPRYEVETVAAEPCGCRSCRGCGSAWWNPLNWAAWFQGREGGCSCR